MQVALADFLISTEKIFGWLVGCFGFNGPLRQYFSLYRAVSQKEGKRRARIEENKNVQTTPTRTYCKGSRPLPYCYPNCRTPRHWKLTQPERTTRPPPKNNIIHYKHIGYKINIMWQSAPGRVAQSVGHLTRKSRVLGSILGLATYFRFSFRFFKKGSCQLLAKVCARSTG